MNQQNNAAKTRNGFNKFLLVYFIVSVVIIALISAGFTFKAKEFRDRGPFGIIMGKIIKDLDLNDQQKAEVEKIRDEVKAKMDETMKNREEDMKEFGFLFKQDNLSKEQLMSLSQKHDARREEMKSFFMDELIKVHAILTPEQRTKAVEKMKELKEKRKERKDKMHPKDKHWDD